MSPLKDTKVNLLGVGLSAPGREIYLFCKWNWNSRPFNPQPSALTNRPDAPPPPPRKRGLGAKREGGRKQRRGDRSEEKRREKEEEEEGWEAWWLLHWGYDGSSVSSAVIEDKEIVYRDYVDISLAVATPKVCVCVLMCLRLSVCLSV